MASAAARKKYHTPGVVNGNLAYDFGALERELDNTGHMTPDLYASPMEETAADVIARAHESTKAKVRPAERVSPVMVLGFAAVLRFTWAGPVSLLAFTASAFSTVCYWSNNARTLRLANLLVASPCWLVYDFIVRSWGGMASEAITIISILISIRRFGWKALGDPNSQFQQG